jgi:hypothetical protein
MATGLELAAANLMVKDKKGSVIIEGEKVRSVIRSERPGH